MIKQLTIYVFLVFVSLNVIDTEAQPWTLQQCIDYALANNITIKQSELNAEQNKAYLDQSRFALFPTLNGYANNNYYYGRSIDPYTNQFTENQVRSNSFSLNSNLALFQGLQLQNALKQSRLNYLSGKYELQKIQNDIALNVVTYYLQILYNQQLLNIAKEQRDATVLQRDKTKRMEELGSVSRGNLLDIESQLASDELTVITAQSQLDQSTLSLKQLLELDASKDFSIVEPSLSVPQFNTSYGDVEAINSAALTNQPDIKSFEYKVMSAEKGLSYYKGGLYPRISMSGSLSTTYSTSSKRISGYELTKDTIPTGYTSSGDIVYTLFNNANPLLEQTPFNDQLKNNLNKSLGFSLVIPFFNNWSTQTNIRRAKLNLEQTRLNFEAAKKTLYKNIQIAVADASASNNKYIAGEKNLQAKEEAFNFSQKRYEAGMLSTYDYLIAKNNLAKAKADLLQSKYDYIFRLKVLDFYMGRGLTF